MIVCGVHAASAANTRRHVHNLCMRRVLVRSASVQRGYVRDAPTIDEIHRSREEKGKPTTSCVLGQYELCTGRECKVHAEQTSRSNASEWTELHLSPPPPPSSIYMPRVRASRRCLMHARTKYSKILAGTNYKVLGASSERARVNVPRESLVSFSASYCIVYRRSPSYPEVGLRFSLYRFPSSSPPSPPFPFGISSFLFSHCVLF